MPDINILKDYIPNNGHILVTSRNPKLLGAIEIDVMTKKESKQLLDKLVSQKIKTSYNYEKKLLNLAQELGYLPLALSHAGAYITENNLTIEEYLALYSTERNKLLSDQTMPIMDEHQPAYITWDMSLKKIYERW